MRTWAVLAMVISLAPVAIWAATTFKERRERQSLRASARVVDGSEPALAATSSTTTGGN